MFTVFCTSVAAEILLDASAIEALVTRDGRVAIEYRCSCGERGLWDQGHGQPHRSRPHLCA